VAGDGRHRARVHWLCGPFPFVEEDGGVMLDTPDGPFTARLLGADGAPLPASVVSGREHPIRGWASRYYGERAAVPSLAAEVEGDAPLVFVSVLAGGRPRVEVDGEEWSVEVGALAARFRIRDGAIVEAGGGAAGR
jgi:hypothetical protein